MSLQAKGLINQFIISDGVAKTQANDAITNLLSLINTNEVSFLSLIESLGHYLVDDDSVIRLKGLTCLSEVLQKLDKSKLTKKDINVLIEFFAKKLDQTDTIQPILNSLNCLILMDNFINVLIIKILNSLVEIYDPKSNIASSRFLAFNLLNTICTAHNSKFLNYCVNNLNDNVINCYLHISQNEKDPKNLMISFKLNAFVSHNFQIDNFSEELFDACFCYFPISFRAPENDPYKITGDELKLELRRVLAANDLFAKDSFPNLIEKLSSTSSIVKSDVLETINLCIQSYKLETVENYWISLWNSLKFEILHKELAINENLNDLITYYSQSENEDERTIPLILSSFQNLCARYNAEEHDESSLKDYIILIIDELSKNLVKPDDSKSKQSTIILASIASTNLDVSNLVISRTFPVFLSYLIANDSDAPSEQKILNIRQQRSLIINVSFFLDAYYKLFNLDNIKLENIQQNYSIFKFKDEILSLIQQTLVSSSTVEITLRCLSIKLIAKTFQLRQFLDLNEKTLLLEILTDILLNDNNLNTNNQTITTLQIISKSNATLILDITLPKLLIHLPDTDVDTDTAENMIIDTTNDNNQHTKEKILELILSFCNSKEIIDSILIRLLNKFETIINSNSSTYYSRLILLIISKILNKLNEPENENSNLISTNDYLKKFLPRFLYLSLNSIIIDSKSNIYRDPISIDYVARIVSDIIGHSDLSLHQDILTQSFNLFILNNVSETEKLISNSLPFLNVLDNGDFSILFPIFTSIVCVINKDTELPVDKFKFVNELIEISNKFNSIQIRLSHLQLLSLILNKWFTPKDLINDDYLNNTLNDLKSKLNSSEISKLEKLKFLEILIWIIKSLIIRIDNTFANDSLIYLIGLINTNSSISDFIPKCLEILFSDPVFFKVYKSANSKQSQLKPKIFNINLRALYKQKYFNLILPIILDNFNNNSNDFRYKKNYLISLSLILKNIEKSIILPHLVEILPLILQALKVNSNSIKSSSLNILEIAITENPKLIIDQLQTTIPLLLDIINEPSSNSESKSVSLKCLIALAVNDSIKLQTLIPYKDTIIRNITLALDDNKRNVRKLASNCRQLYCDLGQERSDL
ncbi:hypothetical protein B5S28_g1320 [[Candida] boidinii]|nr:hypothetical protein B5S28_g1320 [[Candida] boidinii]